MSFFGKLIPKTEVHVCKISWLECNLNIAAAPGLKERRHVARKEEAKGDRSLFFCFGHLFGGHFVTFFRILVPLFLPVPILPSPFRGRVKEDLLQLEIANRNIAFWHTSS